MIHFLALVERGREARFAMQQELVYKVYARRNQLFAEWAAGLMGYGDAAAERYVTDVLDHIFGDTDALRLLARVGDDLAQAGVRQSEGRLLDKLYELEGRSCADVMERITGKSNVVPLRRAKPEAQPVLNANAQTSLDTIDLAVRRAKEELFAEPQLQFRDMFLSMVHSPAQQAAE
jgi:hypothetical protein